MSTKDEAPETVPTADRTSKIPALTVGRRVRFATPTAEARYWWDARRGDDRYTILTRQAQFHPKGEVYYTIIDRERGVRGPCNLIGQGWDIHMDDDACARLLEALRRHDEVAALSHEPGSVVPDGVAVVEVSYRNNVLVDIAEVRG